MNAQIPLALAVGALTLALAACNNDRGDETPATSATVATSAPAAGQNDSGAAGGYDMDNGATREGHSDVGMAGANPDDASNDPTTMAMSSADRDQIARASTQAMALQMVMDVDQHEIAAAEQAEGKKLDPDVKAYAETLKKDHTKNLATTRSLMADGDGAVPSAASNTNGAADSELEAMRSKHESERSQLASLDGDAYQAAWLDAMVNGHTEALDKLDSQLIPATDDAKVKQHLVDTRNVIAKHLETAKALRTAQ